MKNLKKLFLALTAVSSLIVLSGCALGAATSATAGYSLKSQSADSLTADAEQRIVDRTKREIMADLTGRPSISNYQ